MNTLFSTIPKLAWCFTEGARWRYVFVCVQLWFFVITRKLLLCTNDTYVRIHHRGGIYGFWLRYAMDLAVLREIYIEKEYDWCPDQDIKVIIDLGAHFGDTTLYYHALFPDATIIAVEPTPESYARLVKNTQNMSNIITVQAAVGASDGVAHLHLMPSSLGNSLMERKDSTVSIDVPQLSLRTLLSNYEITNVDILKFDIEGAEFSLFNDKAILDHIRSFIGEVHEDLGGMSVGNFVSHFSKFAVVVEPLQNKNRFIVKIS